MRMYTFKSISDNKGTYVYVNGNSYKFVMVVAAVVGYVIQELFIKYATIRCGNISSTKINSLSNQFTTSVQATGDTNVCSVINCKATYRISLTVAI